MLRTNFTDTFFTTALPALEEVIYSTMESYPDLIPVLSNYKKGDWWGAQTTEQSGLTSAVTIPEGAPIIFDDPVQGNNKNYTFFKLGLAVRVSEELIEDDRWDQVGDVYRSLGSSMHHARQVIFMNNFNNGFTTNGYDGVPFFSTLHPLIKAGGVEANRPAADVDISVASLRAALTQIASWLTHEGLRSFWRPKFLLVSTTNIYDAHELVRSDYRPGTANNDANAFSIWGLDYVSSPYLTDNDAWFIGCDEHKLMFYDRKTPTVSSFPDWDASSVKTKILSRIDTGHSSWYGWWGSRGA